MEKTRHFIVDTPVGQLAIYAKHDKTDCAADYPGVFIDYVRKDGATAILACVEYDPNKKHFRLLSTATVHLTSRLRSSSTTILILKSKEDRLCLIGRLGM